MTNVHPNLNRIVKVAKQKMPDKAAIQAEADKKAFEDGLRLNKERFEFILENENLMDRFIEDGWIDGRGFRLDPTLFKGLDPKIHTLMVYVDKDTSMFSSYCAPYHKLFVDFLEELREELGLFVSQVGQGPCFLSNEENKTDWVFGNVIGK